MEDGTNNVTNPSKLITIMITIIRLLGTGLDYDVPWRTSSSSALDSSLLGPDSLEVSE
jgi:hypothetical protein